MQRIKNRFNQAICAHLATGKLRKAGEGRFREEGIFTLTSYINDFK